MQINRTKLLSVLAASAAIAGATSAQAANNCPYNSPYCSPYGAAYCAPYGDECTPIRPPAEQPAPGSGPVHTAPTDQEAK